jgi:hypothetical protein
VLITFLLLLLLLLLFTCTDLHQLTTAAHWLSSTAASL